MTPMSRLDRIFIEIERRKEEARMGIPEGERSMKRTVSDECPRCGKKDALMVCAACGDDLCRNCLPGGNRSVCVQCQEEQDEGEEPDAEHPQ